MNDRNIEAATDYFDEHVGHYTDKQRFQKLLEEIAKLGVEINTEQVDKSKIIDECSDVLAVAFHIAKRAGFEHDPNELFLMAFDKMKYRIDNGLRDYKNIGVVSIVGSMKKAEEIAKLHLLSKDKEIIIVSAPEETKPFLAPTILNPPPIPEIQFISPSGKEARRERRKTQRTLTK